MQHNDLEWVDRRLDLLNTACRLAMEDNNPDNRKENTEIILKCRVSISSLLKIKQLTVRP